MPISTGTHRPVDSEISGEKWGGALWILEMQPLFQGSGKPRGQQSVILRDNLSIPPPVSRVVMGVMEFGVVVSVWNDLLVRNLRYPLLYRAQENEQHSVDFPVNFCLELKLWLVRSSSSAPLTSTPQPPPGLTGRIRTPRAEGRSWHELPTWYVSSSVCPQPPHLLWALLWMVLEIHQALLIPVFF